MISINKKITMSAFSIITALTMLGGSAFAAFTATATASGSTFSTGTDSILLSSDNNSDYNQTITSPFSDTKLSPGYNRVFTFYIENSAATSNDNLNITANFSGGTANPTLDGVMMTQFSCNDPINGITTASPFDVTSMRTGSVSLGKINSGEIATCTLTVSIPSSADNTIVAQSTSFDVVFNASQ